MNVYFTCDFAGADFASDIVNWILTQPLIVNIKPLIQAINRSKIALKKGKRTKDAFHIKFAACLLSAFEEEDNSLLLRLISSEI